MIECVPTIFPLDDQATPMGPGQTLSYTAPDICVRPWPEIWKRHYEDGMARPQAETEATTSEVSLLLVVVGAVGRLLSMDEEVVHHD